MKLFVRLFTLVAALTSPLVRGNELEVFPSFYLPRQGVFNLVDQAEGLFDSQHQLFSTDSDEALKTATATHSAPFTIGYFAVVFGQSPQYGGNATFDGTASFRWWVNQHEAIHYQGEVIQAASSTSGGLDGGTNAIAFALGSSLDDLRFFFQFRLKGSAATVADSSLAEAAVAQGMWKDADEYVEIDVPYISSTWIGSNNWPLGHDTYYVENIPEPASVFMASLGGAGLIALLRRR